jgi:hypothetical protein
MRRILFVLTVALVMAAMVAVMAAPAFAHNSQHHGHQHGKPGQFFFDCHVVAKDCGLHRGTI